MNGAMTTRQHWEGAWATPPRMRLPSELNISIRDQHRLLRRHVTPGMSFLEIGCAPGKNLAWVSAILKARVAGLDYSEKGIGYAKHLFKALALEADLRCEDIFATTLKPGSFDVVFSAGVIEHFEDPREIVRQHVLLSKPGGKVVITIPHYGGFYGRLQREFDPESLLIHNLDIMSTTALKRLAPEDLVDEVCTYCGGRVSSWVLSLERRWPRALSTLTHFCLNVMGLLQPLDIEGLCPMLVLEMKRRIHSTAGGS